MSYFAKSTIRHNGQVFNKGDQLPEMSEKELQQLVDSGVVTDDESKLDEVEQHENTGKTVAMNVESKQPAEGDNTAVDTDHADLAPRDGEGEAGVDEDLKNQADSL